MPIHLHDFVQKLALTLPEVHCSQPFGDGCDVYKVMDKVFLLSTHLKGQAICNLKVLPDEGVMLREIYPYIHVGWHMNKKHWISIYQHQDIDQGLLQDLVKNSYALVVSKLNKLQRQRIELLQSINKD